MTEAKTMRRIGRALVLAVVIVFLGQLSTWWFLGRKALVEAVGNEVVLIVSDEVIVNWKGLRALPAATAELLLHKVSEKHRVWQEHDVPPSYYGVEGKTGDGRELRFYERGKRVSFAKWQSNFLFARIDFSVYQGTFSARGYRLRYLWVMGVWLQLGTTQQTWIS